MHWWLMSVGISSDDVLMTLVHNSESHALVAVVVWRLSTGEASGEVTNFEIGRKGPG